MLAVTYYQNSIGLYYRRNFTVLLKNTLSYQNFTLKLLVPRGAKFYTRKYGAHRYIPKDGKITLITDSDNCA